MNFFHKKSNEDQEKSSKNSLDKTENLDLGTELPIGSHHFRAYVGPPQKYDIVAANQFNLLTSLGLREYHSLLDIGCGSLRGGRLFIPYLLPEMYFGIEPEQWLIEEGIKNNLGKDILKIKKPKFTNDGNFTLSGFNQNFDFILAQSIFSHATQNQIKRCLSEAKKVMTPTSRFVATFVKGEKNNEADKWLYPGCGEYTLDFMISLISEQGLTCKPLKWKHPNGQTWMLISSKENQDEIPDL